MVSVLAARIVLYFVDAAPTLVLGIVMTFSPAGATRVASVLSSAHYLLKRLGVLGGRIRLPLCAWRSVEPESRPPTPD